jgi:uncharacterized membrane protein (UPF0182 family)
VGILILLLALGREITPGISPQLPCYFKNLTNAGVPNTWHLLLEINMIQQNWRLLLVVAVILGLVFLNSLVSLYVDWLWFNELQYPVLFLKGLLTRITLAFLLGALFLAVLLANLLLARRFSSTPSLYFSQSLFELPQFANAKPLIQKATIVIAILFSFIIGQWSGNAWDLWLRFQNSIACGTQDPLFQRDLGFYLFELPFYKFLYQYAFALLVFSALLSVATYLFEGALALSGRGLQLQIGTKPRTHLAVIGTLFFLLFALKYRLGMFDLLYSERGILYGAGYTDIKAHLPALQVMTVLSLVAALLVLWSILRQQWRPGLAGIVLLVGGSLIGTQILPALIQRFEVVPNEISKERPYIESSIQYTRQAYNIDKVQEKEFPSLETLTPALLKKNELTLQNIRLWDHRPLLRTFSQLQVIRPYYDFVDVDNDRYLIDGKYRQVSLSSRELSSAKLPSRIWINEHLTFTHGYGLCLSPVNQITSEGLPQFFIKDLPPVSSTNLRVTRPGIYYGELTDSYCFVKTREKEFDYPSGTENVTTEYQGQGGIPVTGFLRKLMFSLYFREQNILLSREITGESRILFDRNLLTRVKKLMPFLLFDQDPYMVIDDKGEMYWILDAYTASDRYPYSHPVRRGINYLRNSVKITMDAYHGTVRMYLSDPSDPLIQVYGKIFPGVFRPMEEMPSDLRRHLRYPEDLFTLQAQIYATYHMKDPQVFYNKEDLWRMPTLSRQEGESIVEPYYTIMKLPQSEGGEEFLLMTPFAPANRENMIAWMAARCDAPHYGELVVYNFPKQRLVFGPAQIASRMNQDTEISRQLSLWNQKGSTVINGSLLVIPVEQSILYVQPLYLAAEQAGSLPELKRIIVAYGDKIAMEETFEQSLSRIFEGAAFDAPPRQAGAPAQTAAAGIKPATQLLEEAVRQYEQAQEALKQGNWAGYGEEIKKLGQTLRELKRTEK